MHPFKIYVFHGLSRLTSSPEKWVKRTNKTEVISNIHFWRGGKRTQKPNISKAEKKKIVIHRKIINLTSKAYIMKMLNNQTQHDIPLLKFMVRDQLF